MKKIIAIINQKGGVGKTTTSINLSCGLAMKGFRVLLIDFDPQGHSTISYGFNSDGFQYAIHDVLINKRNIKEVILKTKIKNLDLVPATLRLDKAEQQLTIEMFKETRLHKAIRNLDYDFIIIDCRPTLGTLTVNAIYACNFCIVPCELSRLSLEGFSDLMDTIENVKPGDELELKNFIRILLTKYDARKTVAIDWVMTQLAEYKHLIFDTKIRQDEAINHAIMAQEPIYLIKANSRGAEDYQNLTKELIKLCQA